MLLFFAKIDTSGGKCLTIFMELCTNFSDTAKKSRRGVGRGRECVGAGESGQRVAG